MNPINAPKQPIKKRFEPMLLLVIGIPLLTVIAGIITLFIAFDAPSEIKRAPSEVHFKEIPLK